MPLAADMTHRGEVKRLAERATAALGKVDILINNAGGNVPQPIDQITDEIWDHFVELNLSSCMALTRALVPQMKDRKWGRVIHISSIMGFTSIPERNVYSATKSALLGFLTELILTNFTEEARQKFADRTALGRFGDLKELAGPVLLLASEAGSYITGACLVVDGGTIVKTM